MTKLMKIGNVAIGNGNRIAIQSMTNTKTEDITNTISQINELQKHGCDIVRMTINNELAADAIKTIKSSTSVPLVADIHYDYKLAVASINNGIDKVRLNPGNLPYDKAKYVIEMLKERNIPLRIGVNSGSVREEVAIQFGGRNSDALVHSALEHVNLCKQLNYDNICISVKSSDVVTTIKAYRKLADMLDYPLHLGVTEAGVYSRGIVKSSIGIGALLIDNIGDTIRVSLSGNPIREVIVAQDILNSVGLFNDRIDVISCPTCGRTEIDVEHLAEEIILATSNIKSNIKIAVMGCTVNGLGEGKEADIGVAGGKDKSIIFKKGKQIKTVSNTEILPTLLQLINEVLYV